MSHRLLSLSFPVTGVVHYYLFSQPGPVDVRVYFGGHDAFVPQHGLYDTQVCTAFKKVRRE